MRKPETQAQLKQFTTEVPIEKYEQLLAVVKAKGTSRNKFMNMLISNYLKEEQRL